MAAAVYRPPQAGAHVYNRRSGSGPLQGTHTTAAVVQCETVGVGAKIILSAYEKWNKTIKLVLYYCTLESCMLQILIPGIGCRDVICFG